MNSYEEKLLNDLQQALRANGLSQNVTYAPFALYYDFIIASQLIYAYTPQTPFPFIINLLMTDKNMGDGTQYFPAFSRIIRDANGQYHYIIVCSPILLKLPYNIRIATLIHEYIHLLCNFDYSWMCMSQELKEGITEVCSREIQNNYQNIFPEPYLFQNYTNYVKTVDHAIEKTKIPYKTVVENLLDSEKFYNFYYLTANFPDLLDA